MPTSHVILKTVRTLLRKHLAESALDDVVDAVCPDAERREWSVVLRAMCFQFTAYTHLRRLLILRLLLTQGEADLVTIMREIGMSRAAARRHLDKLARRGIVDVCRSEKRSVVRIAGKSRTAFQASLWAAVRDYLTSR